MSQKRSLPPVQTIHVLRPLISSAVSAIAAVHVVEVVFVGGGKEEPAARRGALRPGRAPVGEPCCSLPALPEESRRVTIYREIRTES